jgi:phage terminase Nu1 subunit (DNA packaging protein)
MDREIDDRDQKIDSLQRDIKKLMTEKADKDSLIKSNIYNELADNI